MNTGSPAELEVEFPRRKLKRLIDERTKRGVLLACPVDPTSVRSFQCRVEREAAGIESNGMRNRRIAERARIDGDG